MKKKYLALVNDNFEVNQVVKDYFEQEGIIVLNHFKTLNVLKLVSENALENRNLKYISHVEPDGEMYIEDAPKIKNKK